MKILPTKNIHISNCSIVKRIKDFFLPKKTTMQNIEKDVFEKTVSDGVEKMERKQIYPRKLPNCVSGPNEYDQMVPGGGGEVQFYKKDRKKMEGMSTSERLAFKKQLLNEGRYYSPLVDRIRGAIRGSRRLHRLKLYIAEKKKQWFNSDNK